MIVCSCKAVSERRIAELAVGGHTSVEAIGRACGAGTDCGSCRDEIADIVGEAVERGLVPACRLGAPRAA